MNHSVHSFWGAEINRRDFILSERSVRLPCFGGRLIHSEQLSETCWGSRKVEKPLEILQIRTILTGGKNIPRWACLVVLALSSRQTTYAKGRSTLSCCVTGLSPVFSECSFASCDSFLFKNVNLSSRVIKSVLPPTQLPI